MTFDNLHIYMEYLKEKKKRKIRIYNNFNKIYFI